MRDDKKYQRRHLWMRTWKGERGLNGELLNDYQLAGEAFSRSMRSTRWRRSNMTSRAPYTLV